MSGWLDTILFSFLTYFNWFETVLLKKIKESILLSLLKFINILRESLIFFFLELYSYFLNFVKI